MPTWLPALVLALVTGAHVSAGVTTVQQGGGPRVSIHVESSQTAITCRVPKNAANRMLFIGIADQLSSERQLDGESAPITHRLQLRQRVDCAHDDYWEIAFCELVWREGADYKRQIVSEHIMCRMLP